MPYIALKQVRFDRDYLIGERIPNEVVYPARADGIIAMGLIARLPEAAPVEPQEAQVEAEAAEDPQGPQKKGKSKQKEA